MKNSLEKLVRRSGGRGTPLVTIFLAILLLLIPILWFGCSWHLSTRLGKESSQTPLLTEKIRVGDFSPDDKKIYLDYCDTTRHCQIGWLDLNSQKISLFSPQNIQDVLASPAISDDGLKLAMVVKEAARGFESSQLAILDLNRNTYRLITHSEGMKEWPSFSHDGKKLIYAQANRLRLNGKTKFTDWDIYEVELASGKERRLTNFCFFLISRPKYMPDNKLFVFSAEEPSCNFSGQNVLSHYGKSDLNMNEVVQKGRAQYKKQYQDNTVYMQSVNENSLRPILINGESSFGGILTRDGKRIFFLSKTNQLDNLQDHFFHYDIFSFENGKTNRHTNLRSNVSGMAVSAHGEYILFHNKNVKNNDETSWLMNIRTGVQQEIVLSGNKTSLAITEERGGF